MPTDKFGIRWKKTTYARANIGDIVPNGYGLTRGILSVSDVFEVEERITPCVSTLTGKTIPDSRESVRLKRWVHVDFEVLQSTEHLRYEVGQIVRSQQLPADREITVREEIVGYCRSCARSYAGRVCPDCESAV